MLKSGIAKRLAVGFTDALSERVYRFKLIAADSLALAVSVWQWKKTVEKSGNS